MLRALSLTALLLAGCGDKDDDNQDTGDTASDADQDTGDFPSDTDADTDADAYPIFDVEDATTWGGTMLFGQGPPSSEPNNLRCQRTWTSVGVPSTELCPECTFSFAVDFILDESNIIGDPNDCEMFEDYSFVFSYNPSYYDSYFGTTGPALMYPAYNDQWFRFFDIDSEFNSDGAGSYYFDYSAGIPNYEYTGNYYNYYFVGSATLGE